MIALRRLDSASADFPGELTRLTAFDATLDAVQAAEAKLRARGVIPRYDGVVGVWYGKAPGWVARSLKKFNTSKSTRIEIRTFVFLAWVSPVFARNEPRGNRFSFFGSNPNARLVVLFLIFIDLYHPVCRSSS